MPIFNRRGDHYTAGFAGEQGSLDGAYYPFRTYGGGVFLDADDSDQRVLLQLPDPAPGALAIYQPGAGDPVRLDPVRGANSFSAGGGRFVAWANGIGVFGAVNEAAAGIPDHCMGPDGTVGYVPNYQVGRGLILVGPDDVRQAMIPGIIPYDLQVLGPGKAIWKGGSFGRPTPLPAFQDAAGLKLVTFRGKDYLVYWSNARSALVLQVDGAKDGWILDTRPNEYHHDAVATEAGIRMIWSITAGERPQDLVICEFTGGAPFYTKTAVGFQPMPAKFEELKLPDTPIDPPKPDPLAVTITSYSPSSGEAPLTVLAVAKVTSGKCDTLTWRQRVIGAPTWDVAAVNPVGDLDHHYRFDQPGNYEISLLGTGPAGTAETVRLRPVTVTRKEDPVDPTPEPVLTNFLCHDGTHYLTAEDGGGHEGERMPAPGGKTRAKGLIVADRDQNAAWQQFEVRRGRGPDPDAVYIGLKGNNGTWVSAEKDGTLVCNRDRPADFVPEAWEAFEVIDQGDGLVALKTAHGFYVTAEGGGGSTVTCSDRGQPGLDDDLGIWQQFKPDPPLSAAGGGSLVPVKGILRAAGHCLVDDNGPILLVGTTLFPLGWMFKFDRERLRKNLAYLKGRVHFVRALAVIGGKSWEDRDCDPRWPDWMQVIAGATDLCYDEFGILVQWTVWGGLDPSCPNRSDRDRVIDQLASIIAARPHKVASVEVMNEAGQNGFGDKRDEAKTHCRTLRSRIPNLVSVTAPGGQPSDEAMAQEVRSWYEGSNATAIEAHLDRSDSGTGGLWRYVRQPWEVQFWGGNPPAIWKSNEPKGPRSSVAMDDDPERQAMAAATDWICGLAAATEHTGAGVRMGGAADQGGGKFYLPREANLFEVPQLDAILNGIGFLHSILPADCPNGARQNSNNKFPDHPFDYQELTEDKVLRVYATNIRDQFAAACIQVMKPMNLKAKRNMHLRVYSFDQGTKTWGLTQEQDLAAGQAIVVTGPPAGAGHIVVGNYR